MRSYIKNNFNKYSLFISTGTPTFEIEIILKKLRLSKYFKAVFGSPENKDLHIPKELKNNII